MALRALPLTDKSRPGGRSRDSRAPSNAFAVWLRSCGMTPEEVAAKLKVSPSSVYNARNGYFVPGRALAVRIAELSTPPVTRRNRRPVPAVPVSSWDDVQARPRKKSA
jgi:DNA-binding XRE family transcriptional regulator